MNNSQKGFVVPLLIGIIALLVVGGGVYIYQNEKIEVPEVVDTTQLTNQIQQQTNTQASPVSIQRINVPSQTDSSFNIIAPNTSQPSITILSPNGGEMWQEGIVYPIRWSAKNISGNQTIKLVNSNNTVIRTIDPNVKTVNGGTGLYQLSWSIPQAFVSEASPGKFKILISSSDNTISDYSDNQFTIYASGRGY